jgi:hypothetical protein
MALAIGLDIELGQPGAGNAQTLERGAAHRVACRSLPFNKPVEVGPVARIERAVGQHHAALLDIEGALKIHSHADRPDHGRHIERQRVVQRITALAVDLVDEGDDRNVAQAADLEQLQRLAFDAARRIDHHDGGIDGGERAIGVFGKVGMARRIEQIEGQALMLEGHHRAGDGDAAFLLDLHPVGIGAATLASGAHMTGEPDRTGGVEQPFGQRRLAGIGMGDDGKGAPR